MERLQRIFYLLTLNSHENLFFVVVDRYALAVLIIAKLNSLLFQGNFVTQISSLKCVGNHQTIAMPHKALVVSQME